jgi:hypothetical protein
MRLAIFAEGFDDSWVGFVAERFERSDHKPEARIGHDGAL